MALPDKVKHKIAVIALEDAAGEMAKEKKSKMDKTVEDTDDYLEDCRCPKCGHTGSRDEFKED
jgi:hypothetical protein